MYHMAWEEKRVSWILSLAGILMLAFPLAETACTPEAKREGERCKDTLEAETKILGNYFTTPDHKTVFCRDSLELCIQNVATASSQKCPKINASDETYHGMVNALRGLCRELSAYRQYSGCISSQQGQIKDCDLRVYGNKSEFERTQYNKGVFATDLDRKNAHCRLIRYAQMCYETVIQINCQSLLGYFRDYQVALLTPYCRQLLELTSRYVGDDPNAALSLFVSSREQLVVLFIAVLSFIQILT